MTPAQQKGLLELISTDDLYDELLNRFEHIIISGLKSRPEADQPGIQVTSWRYKGNPFMCIGLAMGIVSECQDARVNSEDEIDAGDL